MAYNNTHDFTRYTPHRRRASRAPSAAWPCPKTTAGCAPGSCAAPGALPSPRSWRRSDEKRTPGPRATRLVRGWTTRPRRHRPPTPGRAAMCSRPSGSTTPLRHAFSSSLFSYLSIYLLSPLTHIRTHTPHRHKPHKTPPPHPLQLPRHEARQVGPPQAIKHTSTRTTPAHAYTIHTRTHTLQHTHVHTQTLRHIHTQTHTYTHPARRPSLP